METTEQTQGTTEQPVGENVAQQNGGAFFIPMILIFAFFWLFFIRPETKKHKQAQTTREDMIASVAVGNKIETIGGIIGTVESVDEKTLRVCVDKQKKIVLTFSRGALKEVIEKK